LVINAHIQGQQGWSFLRGAQYDGRVSRTQGSGSLNLTPPGSQVQSEFIPVTPGRTYTFAAYLVTTAWPAFAYNQIAVYDQTGHFKYNWSGSYQATSAANRWQETVLLFTPHPGDAKVRLSYGRPPAGRSPRNDGGVWVDDFYFGEGVGFEQAPSPKKPFHGSSVRVDALGNFEVRRGERWEPFFPFGVYRASYRTDFTVYSNQGFNCIFSNNLSVAILEKAVRAVSPFNPNGMMSMIDIEQYIDRREADYKHLDDLGAKLPKLCRSPLSDHILAFYWDNEQYGEYELAETVCRLVDRADRDDQGRRSHPIFMLHGGQGVTRVFNDLADVVGDYLRDEHVNKYLGLQQNTLQRFAILHHLENQRNPVTIGIISEEETAEGVRALVYEHLIAGGKGIAYFRDGNSYDYNGDKHSKAATDITYRACWQEFPKLRREVDALLPLIRQSTWTRWGLICGDPEIIWGTRELGGEGYVLLVNPSPNEKHCTFTIKNLPYAPIRVQDYFSQVELSPVNGSRFTIHLAAHATAVVKLAR
jgi:hypothetical protein